MAYTLLVHRSALLSIACVIILSFLPQILSPGLRTEIFLLSSLTNLAFLTAVIKSHYSLTLKMTLITNIVLIIIIYSWMYFEFSEELFIRFFPLIFIGGWNGNLAMAIAITITVVVYGLIGTTIGYLLRQRQA